jgi:hypothetical protein
MSARAAATLLALAAAVAFICVPVLHRSTDTDPQLFTAASWIIQGDAPIDEYPPGQSNEIVVRGHEYSSYPLGLGLVSAPVLAPFVISGMQLADIGARALFGRLLAVLLAASSIGFMYLACVRIARPVAALAATTGYAFGTATWAIASQELTQHAPAQLFIAIGLWLLARQGAAAPRAGLALGLATLTRPLILIVFGAGALAARRIGGIRALVRYVAWGLPAAAFLVTYNLIVFGSPSGALYGDPIPWAFPPPGLAGLLVSPSRGLFVFSPFLLLAVAGIWRAWRTPPDAATVLVRELSLAAIASSWIAYASVSWWWAGWSYGNRYLLDAVPLLTLAMAYALDRGTLRGRVGWLLAGAAFAWSALLQFAGALYAYTYWNGYNWNATPSIDATPQRLWDWSDPQWWSVLRQLITDPGAIVVPALLGVLLAGLILRPLVARTLSAYSARAASGGV